jgi:hypothetical protein
MEVILEKVGDGAFSREGILHYRKKATILIFEPPIVRRHSGNLLFGGMFFLGSVSYTTITDCLTGIIRFFV